MPLRIAFALDAFGFPYWRECAMASAWLSAAFNALFFLAVRRAIPRIPSA
jgi:hypothetical protein